MSGELLALLLLAAVAPGLARLAYGPTSADRMLVAQLLGSAGVALTLAVGAAGIPEGGRTVALILALLAAVSGVAFVRRHAARPGDGGDHG